VNYNAHLPDFLPGRLVLERGSARDYHALAAFHYAAGPPATWAGVWMVRYFDSQRHVAVNSSRSVAVGVLSYPVPSCRPRERWFGLAGARDAILRAVNANLRTISRVVVHPQFRALGLSTLLVRCLCAHCDTRYVEAIAQMGHVHPLFTRAGMTRTNLDHPDEPAYFVLDRHAEAEVSPELRAA
jgi:ABC-type ATPase with predicted acetyltransferase domain